MKSINIEGISFTEEGIQFLKRWITPPSETGRSPIEINVSEINEVQSFLLKNWDIIEDNIDDNNFNMKLFITGLQWIKEYLCEFMNGIKTANHE
ncbi:hypothetical protein SDC9_91943 [bioreactor metagenome]|uniref:Uncharacterized protein n=1 Tax=bioreactor metagenome TaxID=1076179 RepID=A0A644ZWX4_9ZZZZ|nr:hypothetical protein [Proteiniphilum sp.]MEA4918162.1 hypothetical protein [Proteiniphilum sp.]